MPILTPSEAKRTWSPQDTMAVLMLEHRVNDALREWDRDRPLCIAIDGMPSHVVKRVEESIGAAGWNVARKSYQRDGEWLQIEVPRG